MQNVRPFPSVRAGFTIVELLIVVAIIGLLAGLVSTAVVKMTRTAVEKRNANNAKRLEAAIVEYWHDMGRWPVPTDAKPTLQKAGTKAKENGSDETVDVYAYELKYAGDNGTIVGKLLDESLPDGTKKNFLDLHGFMTPVQDKVSRWPVDEVVDAWAAHEGTAVDDAGTAVAKRANPTVVHYSKFIECSVCHHYSAASAQQCEYGGCPARENYHGRYFTRAEKDALVAKAIPYSITIDLNNNIVRVSESNAANYSSKNDSGE